MTEVIRCDHHFRVAHADLRLAGVQLTEAHREMLPRLMARGFFEMPISESGVDTVFSGGVFLRFDLIRACLSRNTVTVAQVTQQARREKCRAAAATTTHALFNRLVELDALLRADEHNQSFLRLAAQASTEAAAMFKAGRASSDRWQAWEQRRGEQELAQQRLAVRLQKNRLEVARACRGVPANEPALLESAREFVKRLTVTGAPPATLAESLEEAPAVVEAKLDHFLAEVGILEAKLKRLPTVSLDVGAGQIPVQGDRWRKESGVVPMAEITVPILDMGDISRGIKRAKIRADQARERMIQTVETSRLDIESTRQELAVASAAVRATGRLRQAAAARRGEILALSRAGAATVLDSHEAAWALIEAEAAADQAQRDYRLALLAERVAVSALLDEALEKSVFTKLELKELLEGPVTASGEHGK